MTERPGGRRWWPRWPSRAAVLLAAFTALLASGCAEVPSQGVVQSTPAPQGGSGTNCCALIMSGPQPNWSPTQIVSGFLLASASFAHANAIAREYLTPEASKAWSPGSAVTIVDQAPQVVLQARPDSLQSTVTVVASGREIAMLTSSGQYRPVTGSSRARQQNFILERIKGQWRITGLPGPHALLLPQWLFNLVYKPQNLYFYARSPGGQVLVPDPVFVPSYSTDPATRLMNSLMNGVPGWLTDAVTTAFPAGARLRHVQVLPGPPVNKTAIVSLSLPPQQVRQATLRALDAQLVWTLASRSYGNPLIGSVKLKVNGRVWPASGGAVLDPSDYQRLVPKPPASENVYFMGADGKVETISQANRGGDAVSTPVPGAAGQGKLALTSIAVSPDKAYLAGVSADGKGVYVTDLKVPGGKAVTVPRPRFTGTGFTAPSWDSGGNLWIAGRVAGARGVFVLPRGTSSPQQVQMLPPVQGPVTGLRVAPDGARVAMIVGRGAAARLMIAAIVRVGGEFAIQNALPVGPNVSGVTALTWYDQDHLLAVAGPPTEMQVWEVPVNGNGANREGAPQPGIVSIAAAGPSNPVYLALSGGQLERAATLGEFWSDVAGGAAVTYPG